MFFHSSFFTQEQKKIVAETITDAEAMTSGEIRVHIEATCPLENVLDRAADVFRKLKMDKTVHANGVLIYVAYRDKKFAIIGDSGINEVVPANFWVGIREVMREHFQREEFLEGILFAIRETGLHLKQYFPVQHNDKNELPNEISEG